MPKRQLEPENNQLLSGAEKKRKKGGFDDVQTPLRKLEHNDYTIGWICALRVEYVAAQELLDEEHQGLEYVSQDNNNYALGSIGKHNVVIATLPLGEYGIASAATVARDMLHSFQNVRIGLMVGIGGGAPSENHDIRLGDIVVSAPKDGHGGLFQYDFGQNVQDQGFQPTGFLNQPPIVLRTALAGLQAQYERKGHRIEETVNGVLESNKRLRRQYKRPDPNADRLYQSGVVHTDSKESCILACGPSELILRPERDEDDDDPMIHYGLIASSNQLMKNALLRDRFAAEQDVLCFEMEAAGLMNHFPCVVIRGICDYSDTHKNKEWQGYAAMVAAAYAKDLLYQIAPTSVAAEKRIRDILSEMQEVVTSVGNDIHKLVHKQYSQEHQAILDWLTPVDYAPQHNDFISRRQDGTGQWFLESEGFQNWLKTDGQTLFCPGIPGAGKTIITAIVINHLFANFRHDPQIGIAYIYCNFRRQDDQTVEKVLANLLKQLAQAQPCLPSIVEKLYENHEYSRTRPSLDEITTALHSMAAAYSRTFIVVDALDECQGLSRSRLLDEIFNLQAKTGANLFATSRMIDTIRKKFDGYTTMEISAADGDVLAYLDGQISLRKSDIINDDIQDKIRAGVLKAADGMFLLATFHIDTIMSQPTRGEIKDVLKKLGSGMEGLYEIYKQTMERIKGYSEAFRSLAEHVLIWITHAKRPLSIIEIQHALAVREHMTEFDPDYMPDAKDLKSVCAGLVTTDEESGIIRLVHYTTQEFFQQTQKKWFPEGDSYITKVCVTYLSFDIFGVVYQTDWEFIQRLQSHPLYTYAAISWGHHAREASISFPKMVSFLNSKIKMELSSQALWLEISYEFKRYTSSLKMTGLHLAAYFGLKRAVGHLLQTWGNPNPKDIFNRTPLSWAAKNGHAAVVQQLLGASGVDIDSKDVRNHTPLILATEEGHTAVVRVLLEKGANLKANRDGQTLLFQAVEKGRTEIVQLLINKGADPDSKDHFDQPSLSYAAVKGHTAIVQLLLDEGADLEARDFYGQTPLSWAARGGEIKAIQLLLHKGADMEAEDEWGQTPLLWAAQQGNDAAVQLLLDKGADMKAECRLGIASLSYAALYGRDDVIRLLLAKGADIEASDHNGRTPLGWAARPGKLAAVQILLVHGADLDAREKNGQTPLMLAASQGHVGVMQLLLDYGADIEASDNDGKTPLMLAASAGHERITLLLLDKGADIGATDKDGKTALMLAHPYVVGLLGYCIADIP
ncbi:ankyrin repeat-containing domain protein [Trichoderma chlorosporum]